MYHTFDTYDRAQSYVWYQSEFIHDEKEEQDEVFTHGWTFPPGLHNALTMFASDTPDLMYCNLENGMDTDKYVENLKKKLEVIDPQKDEIIILSDLPGGSPLTNVIAVLGEMEMLEHCVIYTGMNLPLAINVVMTKDSTTLDKLDELVLADTQAKRFVLETDEDDEI